MVSRATSYSGLLDPRIGFLSLMFLIELRRFKTRWSTLPAKSTLKAKLGPEFINEEAQFSSPEELSYKFYLGSKEPGSAKSELEKMRERFTQSEEEERVSRIAQSQARGTAHIGGYHQVKIPLADSVKDHVNKMKSGIVNLVELCINSTNNAVDVVKSVSVSPSEVGDHLHKLEPRFYLYNYQQIRSPAHTKVNIFIYLCPDASAPQMRMVYSTSKPTVAQDITGLGIQFAKRIEIRGGDELADFIRNDLSAPRPSQYSVAATRSYPEKEKTSSAKAVSAPHPIYSLMTGDTSKPAPMKKKIIIPPPGAY